MNPQTLLFLLFALAVSTVESMSSEVDALAEWKSKLVDPNNRLQSWDPTMSNTCAWLNVICNDENSVIRLELGNTELSGPLIPQLGNLINLQYFDASENNISGSIPPEFGNLKSLVSLNLQENQLTGNIPETLGNLTYLRSLKLNSNKLTGKVPANVLELVSFGSLTFMNVSDNYLTENFPAMGTATKCLEEGAEDFIVKLSDVKGVKDYMFRADGIASKNLGGREINKRKLDQMSDDAYDSSSSPPSVSSPSSSSSLLDLKPS